jgi:hypothetical protein
MNRTLLKSARAAVVGAAVLAFTTTAVSAQLPSASTRAMGMGDNFTAAARGFSAVAWNPGNLGLSGNPRMSLTLGTFRGLFGLDPITLSDISDWQGEIVPDQVKQQWLTSIRDEGSQAGTAGTDVTWLALQAGPFAIQASTSAVMVSNISPGIAELILVGNVNNDGSAKAINLSGSTMDIRAFTTVGASFGKGFTMASGARLGVGVTGKYTVGHFVARSQESTGATTGSPIAVTLSFPTVHSDVEDDAFDGNGGSGIGLDIGVGYETAKYTFAATAQNVVNSFEWDETTLAYRPAGFRFDADNRTSEFDTQPISTAPASLRSIVEDLKFKPSFALGASIKQSRKLMIAADARFGGTAGMSSRPPTQVGAGVEYRIIDAIPLRAGAAFVKVDEDNSGPQFGGGIGLELGFFNISASGLRRTTDLGTDNIFMLTVLSWGR